MTERMWYVAVGGQSVGPMSEAELVDALQAGTYAPNIQVYCQGVTEWAPANAVPVLKAHTPPPPPPAHGAAVVALFRGAGVPTLKSTLLLLVSVHPPPLRSAASLSRRRKSVRESIMLSCLRSRSK